MKRILGITLLITVSASPCLCQSTDNPFFKMLKPKPSAALKFADAFIDIDFTIREQISFSLKNKSNSPIEIDWARSSIVDDYGKAHRVLHAGVRYIERDKAPAPTVIPPGAMIDETVASVDSIAFKDGKWETSPIFHVTMTFYGGKSPGLLLPIKIRGVIKNYTFQFEILKIERKPQAAEPKKEPETTISFFDIKKDILYKDKFGPDWPFKTNEMVIGCARDAVVALANEKVYALNVLAQSKTFLGKPPEKNLLEIADSNNPQLMRIILLGLELCKKQ